MSSSKFPQVRVEVDGVPADPLGGCASSEPFALQVLGDSMEPEFPDQCIVVIEPSEMHIPGAYVFVEVEGVRWFRHYIKDDEGVEWLIALNDLYPPIELTGLDWKMLGLIVQRSVKRKVKHYKYA
ncbi:MAG: S24 family peptidase [Pseudomonadota bacterium]